MEQILSLTLVALLAAADTDTAKSHIDFAWNDISSPKFAEEGLRADIRYLSLYPFNAKEREDYIKVLHFALNSLGTNRRIQTFDVVEGSNNGLLRFRLSQLGFKRAAYEAFENNPYFNAKKFGKEESFRKLLEVSQSHTIILRADWFLAKAFTQPMYYKLLGVNNLEDFKKVISLDEEAAKRINAQQSGVIYLSKVARNRRIAMRSPTLTGFAWSIMDDKKAGDDRDLLRNVLEPKYDTIQILGTLPNGLLAYCIADSKGRCLDFLDPDIAIDVLTKHRDGVVRAGSSCISCHVTGVQPFTDEIREILNKKNIVAVRQADADRIADLFGTKLPFKQDQDRYAEAVKAANGWTAEENAKKFNEVIERYHEPLKDRLKMAAEVGMTPAKFVEFCRGSNHHILLGIAVLGETRPIRRDQWEALFEEFNE